MVSHVRPASSVRYRFFAYCMDVKNTFGLTTSILKKLLTNKLGSCAVNKVFHDCPPSVVFITTAEIDPSFPVAIPLLMSSKCKSWIVNAGVSVVHEVPPLVVLYKLYPSLAKPVCAFTK